MLSAEGPGQECLGAGAIEFPDASPMIWLARIESSLLLKTASFLLARRNPQAGCGAVRADSAFRRYRCSIAALGTPGNGQRFRRRYV